MSTDWTDVFLFEFKFQQSVPRINDYTFKAGVGASVQKHFVILFVKNYVKIQWSVALTGL